MKMTLNVEQVRALVLIAPKKDVRYYLNGALIDFGGSLAVATDGAALIAVRPEDCEGEGNVIVPREALDTISKGGKTSGTVTIESIGPKVAPGGVVLTRDNGITISATATDATYPPYMQAIPETVDGTPGQYNPQLLAKMDKALRLATSAGSSGVFASFTVGYNGQKAALCALPGRGDKAIGVVMPLGAKHTASVDAEQLEFFKGWER